MQRLRRGDRLYSEKEDVEGRFMVESDQPLVSTEAFEVWNAKDTKRGASVTIKVYRGEDENQIAVAFHNLRSRKEIQEFFTGKTGIIRQYCLYKDEATGIRFIVMDSLSPSGALPPPLEEKFDELKLKEFAVRFVRVIQLAHKVSFALGAFSWEDFLLNASGEIRLGDFRFGSYDEKRKIVKKDFCYFAILLVELWLGKKLNKVRHDFEESGSFNSKRIENFEELPSFLQEICNLVQSKEPGISSTMLSLLGKTGGSRRESEDQDRKDRKRKSETILKSDREKLSKSESFSRPPPPPSIAFIPPPNSLEIQFPHRKFYVEQSQPWSLRKLLFESCAGTRSFTFDLEKNSSPRTNKWDYEKEEAQVICDALIRLQRCGRGSSCRKLHPQCDVKPLPKNLENSKKVCVSFVNGECSAGSVCKSGYYHWSLDEELQFLASGTLPNTQTARR
eukprot:TRINITY_DN4345_c0_g1_i1.p1 TRINITY_DN4345_c0_g1~~TRINITY_DN4345_c0_g1_i1.p1  ORF type:complete len:448 (-),score=89.13 TRINITY_DN4345_c0_g1_i1:1072-2415(-)